MIPDNAPLFFGPDGAISEEAQAVLDSYITEALSNQALALEALANRALEQAGGDVSRVRLVKETGPYGCIFRFEVDPAPCPKCTEHPAMDEHTCPFKKDVWYDSEFKCSCCAVCRQECSDSI